MAGAFYKALAGNTVEPFLTASGLRFQAPQLHVMLVVKATKQNG